MKRILISILTIGIISATAFGATQAFFSDTETSVGNVLAAGSLDLQIDSQAHYAGLVCDGNVWVIEDPNIGTTRPDLEGDDCDGTWKETDLGPQHKFFNIDDLKPGDHGENTISLHVLDNDAWGRFRVVSVVDDENVLLDPETEAGDDDTTGEILENLLFTIWLDEGSVAGFQGSGDPEEGDNIHQDNEPLLINEQHMPSDGVLLNIWDGLLAGTPGPGITNDGRLVGSTTYYFGLSWWFDEEAGNDVQSDKLTADLRFEAVQHRNNPNKDGFPL